MNIQLSDDILLSYLEGTLSHDQKKAVREQLSSDNIIKEECDRLQSVLDAEKHLRTTEVQVPANLESNIIAAISEAAIIPTHKTISRNLYERFLYSPAIDWLVAHFAVRNISIATFASVAILLFSISQTKSPSPVFRIPVAEVLVPINDIAPGTKFSAAMFQRQRRMLPEIPALAVTDFKQLEGQFAKTLILADYPIDKRYTSTQRPKEFFAYNIPDGYRVVAVTLDKNRPPDSVIKTGAKFDVVLSAQQQKGAEELFRLVSNAEVLSVNTNFDEADTTKPYVTLLVPAEETAKIDLGKVVGEILLGTPSGYTKSTHSQSA